jgi:DNA-binding NtrC family response regulator
MPKYSCISQNSRCISITGTCLAGNGQTVPSHRILVVEPDSVLRLQLRNAAGNLGGVDAVSGVPVARQLLLTTTHSWLVTNIRLDAYNGLHLAYLARMAQEPPNVLVYGGEADLLLAREAQQLGAFYELQDAIVRSVTAYLTTPLPASDRRDVAARDRRVAYRGGRRSSDFQRFRAASRQQVDSAGAPPVRSFRDP